MARNYNHIYKKLVEDEGDVFGHIAYSIYKSSKIEYIEKFKEEHGAEPTDADLDHFHDISCTDACIDLYQMKAEAIVSEFMEEVLANFKKDMEEDYAHKQDLHLKNIIEPLKPRKGRQFWLSFIASVIGAFVFALVVAFVDIIKSNNGGDDSVRLSDSIKQIIEEVLTSRETQPAADFVNPDGSVSE